METESKRLMYKWRLFCLYLLALKFSLHIPLKSWQYFQIFEKFLDNSYSSIKMVADNKDLRKC